MRRRILISLFRPTGGELIELPRQPVTEQSQPVDFALLAGDDRIERGDGVLLEGQLRLQIDHLGLQFVAVFAHHLPSFVNACINPVLPGTDPIAESICFMGLVYSTDKGRLCPQCAQPVADCRCKSSQSVAAGDGIVRIQRQIQGRGGKTVTVVSGLALADTELKALAKILKQRCGTGGAIKDGTIEIQGDHRETLRDALQQRGLTVKLSGG